MDALIGFGVAAAWLVVVMQITRPARSNEHEHSSPWARFRGVGQVPRSRPLGATVLDSTQLVRVLRDAVWSDFRFHGTRRR